MCGLVGGMVRNIDRGMERIAHRGPDACGVIQRAPFTLGHTRLSIQDLSHASDQPWVCDNIALTYNGELWNPQALRERLPSEWQTTGDTEVVAEVLRFHNVNGLSLLDGMWALAWHDGHYLYLARDAYGEVPLHWGFTHSRRVVYASEVSALLGLGAAPHTIRWVEPGTYLRVAPEGEVTQHRWAQPVSLQPKPDDGSLRSLLTEGSVNRMTSDAPVAVLASGGLDSSAILALLVEAGYKPVTYTAVYDTKASDYAHAVKVTDHLGLDLVPVKVPDPSHERIRAAVEATEMTSKAQIEIALACLELARAISSDGFKVVLSGEGSDELWASYGMAYHGVKRKGWHTYRHDEFLGQHRKNFARTNKVFMRHGVEPRLPFLHDPLVRFALAQTHRAVATGHPKAILANAVKDLLPEKSVWRAKAAFQTEARLDKAVGRIIADPAQVYKIEHQRMFPGVKP